MFNWRRSGVGAVAARNNSSCKIIKCRFSRQARNGRSISTYSQYSNYLVNNNFCPSRRPITSYNVLNINHRYFSASQVTGERHVPKPNAYQAPARSEAPRLSRSTRIIPPGFQDPDEDPAKVALQLRRRVEALRAASLQAGQSGPARIIPTPEDNVRAQKEAAVKEKARLVAEKKAAERAKAIEQARIKAAQERVKREEAILKKEEDARLKREAAQEQARRKEDEARIKREKAMEGKAVKERQLASVEAKPEDAVQPAIPVEVADIVSAPASVLVTQVPIEHQPETSSSTGPVRDSVFAGVIQADTSVLSGVLPRTPEKLRNKPMNAVDQMKKIKEEVKKFDESGFEKPLETITGTGVLSQDAAVVKSDLVRKTTTTTASIPIATYSLLVKDPFELLAPTLEPAKAEVPKGYNFQFREAAVRHLYGEAKEALDNQVQCSLSTARFQLVKGMKQPIQEYFKRSWEVFSKHQEQAMQLCTDLQHIFARTPNYLERRKQLYEQTSESIKKEESVLIEQVKPLVSEYSGSLQKIKSQYKSLFLEYDNMDVNFEAIQRANKLKQMEQDAALKRAELRSTYHGLKVPFEDAKDACIKVFNSRDSEGKEPVGLTPLYGYWYNRLRVEKRHMEDLRTQYEQLFGDVSMSSDEKETEAPEKREINLKQQLLESAAACNRCRHRVIWVVEQSQRHFEFTDTFSHDSHLLRRHLLWSRYYMRDAPDCWAWHGRQLLTQSFHEMEHRVEMMQKEFLAARDYQKDSLIRDAGTSILATTKLLGHSIDDIPLVDLQHLVPLQNSGKDFRKIAESLNLLYEHTKRIVQDASTQKGALAGLSLHCLQRAPLYEQARFHVMAPFWQYRSLVSNTMQAITGLKDTLGPITFTAYTSTRRNLVEIMKGAKVLSDPDYRRLTDELEVATFARAKALDRMGALARHEEKFRRSIELRLREVDDYLNMWQERRERRVSRVTRASRPQMYGVTFRMHPKLFKYYCDPSRQLKPSGRRRSAVSSHTSRLTISKQGNFLQKDRFLHSSRPVHALGLQSSSTTTWGETFIRRKPLITREEYAKTKEESQDDLAILPTHRAESVVKTKERKKLRNRARMRARAEEKAVAEKDALAEHGLMSASAPVVVPPAKEKKPKTVSMERTRRRNTRPRFSNITKPAEEQRSKGTAAGGLNFTPTGKRQAQTSTTSHDNIDLPAGTRSNSERMGIDGVNISADEDFGFDASHLQAKKEPSFEAAEESPNSLAAIPHAQNTAVFSLDDPVSLEPDSIIDSTQIAEEIAELEENEGINEEPHTPLSYQIPDDVLRCAMQASPSSGAAYWGHKLYQGPQKQGVTVHYCANKERSEDYAKLFLNEPVLGFDIEWSPAASSSDGLKENVSLIQLASEGRIGLFHLARHHGDTAEDVMPPTLKQILEAPEIIKAGVNVAGDLNRLRKYLNVNPRGYFELGHLHKLVKYSNSQPWKINKMLVRLAALVEEHLQLPMYKGDVRTSDWALPKLSYEQQNYAASDAYAGIRLFDILEAKRKELYPKPPRPALYELGLPIRLAKDVKLKLVTGAKGEKPEEVAQAEAWVTEYRASRPPESPSAATNAQLRSYAMWHVQKLDVDKVAELLDIGVPTVVRYIFAALVKDELPFETERVKGIKGELNMPVLQWQIAAVLKRAGGDSK